VRVRYLIPIVVLILIFSFSLTCNGTSTETEKVEEVKEVIEDPVEEEIIEIEEKQEKNEVDLETEYATQSIIMLGILIQTMEEISQASGDCADGKIGIAEHKIIAKEYVKNINSCYGMFLELEPSSRLMQSHNLIDKAMEHLLNSATFMQRYIETDDIEKMIDYLGQAISEINLGNEYLNKATEQINKLTEK